MYKIVRLPGMNAWRTGTINKDDQRPPNIKTTPPTPRPSSKRVADAIAAKGYTIFGWDSALEWKPKQPPPLDAIRKALLKGNTVTKGKAVILMHDTMFQTADQKKSLIDFIEAIKAFKDDNGVNMGVVFRQMDTYLTD